MIRYLFAASLLLSLAACLPRTRPNGDPRPADTDFGRLPELLRAISKAGKVALYERLPHQTFEKDQLESEKTVTLSGYPFYADPLPLKPAYGKKLITALSDARSYRDFSGEKLCGGFHPDYAVEFQVGKATYHVLVCFGCGEAKLCGPKRDLRVDLSGDGKQDFAGLLKGYDQNRPEKPRPDVKPPHLTSAR